MLTDTVFLFASRTHPNLPGQPFCLHKLHPDIQYVQKKKHVVKILGRGYFSSRIKMRFTGGICKNDSFTQERTSIRMTKYLPTKAQFLRVQFSLNSQKIHKWEWLVHSGSVSLDFLPFLSPLLACLRGCTCQFF